MKPMGKNEIADKVAARKADTNKWNTIRYIAHLCFFWTLLIAITIGIVATASQILLQDLTIDQKVMWIATQSWPSYITWVVVYYGIRCANKNLGV